MKFPGILIMFILLFFSASGQQGYQVFYEKSLNNNTHAMMFLGGWAVANIVTGSIGWNNQQGHTMRYHQMNVMWNVVNLSIAGVALYSNFTQDIAILSDEEMLNKHIRLENILLINAGLDVLYMGSGYWLTQRAKNGTKRADMYKGYGQSMMLQGAFLFAFDLVFFAIKHKHRTNFLDNVQPAAEGLGFRLVF